MRDLKADLKAILEGATLFGDPNPGVNTQYELYEVAEHAIGRAIKAEKALGNETLLNGKALAKLNERADKAEALARELTEGMDFLLLAIRWGGLPVNRIMIDAKRGAERLLRKAKEVLGDEV